MLNTSDEYDTRTARVCIKHGHAPARACHDAMHSHRSHTGNARCVEMVHAPSTRRDERVCSWHIERVDANKKNATRALVGYRDP